MNLIIDIGNTRIKAAIFNEQHLVRKFLVDQSLDDLVTEDIDHCIVSHTGDLTDRLINSIFDITDNLLILDHRVLLPFENQYDTPATLGRDRIAGIAGARTLYPDQASLVIDAGTCITYDFITADGRYLGGNISPGVEMRLQAMADYTAKLPKADTKYNSFALAKSTETALQNGAVHGVIYEIEGLCRKLIEEHEDFNTILTGGAGHFLSQYLKRKIFVHPDLIFTGLNKILTINAQ